MEEQLEGKVASIISERELTINIGSDNGVKTGMVFKVLANEPLQVTDPDNGDVLGEIDREKVRVEATEVFAKFAICRTFRTRGSNLTALISATEEMPERIKARAASLPKPLSEEESYVKSGDKVVHVKGHYRVES